MQPPAAHRSYSKRLKSRPRRVVLIGASVRAAAQSAKRAGFLVTGIDLFGDTDARAACEQFFLLGDESLESKLAAHCSGFPSLLVGGTNHANDLVARLPSICPPLQRHDASSASVVAKAGVTWQSNHWKAPEWLRHVADRAGVKYPETLSSPPKRSVFRSESSAVKNLRWLVKRLEGSGGLGVQWHIPEGNRSDLASDSDDFGENQPNNRSVIYQQWVPGRAIGVTYLIDAERSRMVGTCRSLWKRQGRLPFVYAGSIGPIQLPNSLAAQLSRLGESIAAETQASGLINVDLIIDRRDRPWLLEINPRWSGSCEVLERAIQEQRASTSLFRDHVDAKLGSLSAPSHEHDDSQPLSVWMKRIMFARRDMRFHREVAQRALSDDSSLHDIPSDGTRIRRGEPICTLLQRIRPGTNRSGPPTNLALGNRHEKNPMREHRVQVNRLHEVLTASRADRTKSL